MARRKKKSTSRPKRRWSLPPLSLAALMPEWSNVARGSRAAAWLIFGGVIVAAWWLGVSRLEAYVGDRTDIQRVRITFRDAPAWIEGDLRDRLVRTIAPILHGDPLQRASLIEAREALLITGWFDAVEQVRRVETGRFEIDARFVDPYAVVRHGQYDHLIDPTGRLLPMQFPIGASERFIAILGTHFDPPMRPGLQWEGADLAAALHVHRLIETQRWREQIRAIDVSGNFRGGPIRLVTDRDSIIVWGSPPGEEAPLESLTERKLAYLNHHFEQHGHIDRGIRGEVDITNHIAVTTR